MKKIILVIVLMASLCGCASNKIEWTGKYFDTNGVKTIPNYDSNYKYELGIKWGKETGYFVYRKIKRNK